MRPPAAARHRLMNRCYPLLADVPGSVAAFEAALVAEEVDGESLRIYLAEIGDALDWARGEGVLRDGGRGLAA